MTLEKIKKEERTHEDIPEEIKVYYNDEEMRQIKLRYEERDDKNDLPIVCYITYPDGFRKVNGTFIDKNNITQIRMYETSHFLETHVLNSKSELINLEKMPYGSIYHISIASKKVIAVSIGDTSESEITGLR